VKEKLRDRDQMNLCFYFSFLPSFYTCEDTAVQEEDATVRPLGAVVGAAAVSGSCVKWSYIFVL
jgi:hypothetical protein